MKNARTLRRIARLLALILAASSFARGDQGPLTSATLGNYGFSTTGGIIHATYPNHPSIPVKIDLYIQESGQWVLNNRCYVNGMTQTGASPSPPGLTWCPFAFPRRSGDCEIKIRAWKIDANGQYANAWDDRVAKVKLSDDAVYTPAVRGRLVTIDKPAYRAKIDPWGGTTYEFYSKRAQTNLPPGELLNSVQTHQGAALQIALHAGARHCLFPTGQGYYNPTQAGASCSFQNGKLIPGPHAPDPADPNSGLTITCDGTSNNHPTQAQNSLEIGLHRMMNWDYGQGYDGPYNPGDQTYMSETVTPCDNYLLYDIHLKNNSRFTTGILETPTYYLLNQFHRIYYPANGSIQQSDIPINHTGDDNHRPAVQIANDAEHWITFEDTLDGVHNCYVTIAWFYTPDFIAPKMNDLLQVYETEVYHQIKMTNVHPMVYQSGKLYHFAYAIFPYRYDEPIPSKYGNLPVRDTIKKLATEYAHL